MRDTHSHGDRRSAGRMQACVVSLAVAACVAFTAGGCSRLKAKAAPEGPPLDMPAPPPRDIETSEVEPPQPIPLIAEPAHNAPPRPRPTPPPQREAPKPEPPKPETPPEPPKPAEEPPRPAPPTLQTMPAGEEGDIERGIRVTLSRAASDLSRVDYRTLNADARTQYDYAKSFIRQAEENLRAKNLVYARTVAEKAAAIAAQLTAR